MFSIPHVPFPGFCVTLGKALPSLSSCFPESLCSIPSLKGSYLISLGTQTS